MSRILGGCRTEARCPAGAVAVGTVVAARDTPAGLEVPIKRRDDAVGAEVAGEIKAGYLPFVDVLMQPLTANPSSFKPRARVLGVQLATIADPGDDSGRVFSVDGMQLASPEEVDARPARPVKPPVIAAAEELLVQAGGGFVMVGQHEPSRTIKPTASNSTMTRVPYYRRKQASHPRPPPPAVCTSLRGGSSRMPPRADALWPMSRALSKRPLMGRFAFGVATSEQFTLLVQWVLWGRS